MNWHRLGDSTKPRGSGLSIPMVFETLFLASHHVVMKDLLDCNKGSAGCQAIAAWIHCLYWMTLLIRQNSKEEGCTGDSRRVVASGQDYLV
jgi:hypothetical protein